MGKHSHPTRAFASKLHASLLISTVVLLFSIPSHAQITIKSADEYKDKAKDIGVKTLQFNVNDILAKYEAGKTYYLYNCLGETFFVVKRDDKSYFTNLKDNQYYTVVGYNIEPTTEYGHYKVRNGYSFNIKSIIVEDGTGKKYSIREDDFKSDCYIPLAYYNKVVSALKGKKVALYNGTNDVIRNVLTGEAILIRPFKESEIIRHRIGDVSELFTDYICTDVFLSEGQLEIIAIIKDQETSNQFGLHIYNYDDKESYNGFLGLTPARFKCSSSLTLFTEKDYKKAVRLYDNIAENGINEVKRQLSEEQKEKEKKRKKEMELKFGKFMTGKIYNKEVVRGMTPEMVTESWGYPWAGKETVTTSHGEEEVWNYYWTKIHFIHGKVSNIETVQNPNN